MIFLHKLAKRIARIRALLPALVMVTSCGDSGTTSPEAAGNNGPFVLAPKLDTLQPGQTVHFSTTAATWSDRQGHPYSVSYSISGGTITSSGIYTAGLLAGTFFVAAACTCGLADTATIIVGLVAPQAAVLTHLTLSPPAVTLVPGGTQQFVVAGSWSDGSSAIPSVTYSVSRGSITSSGLYTAGVTTGTYHIIATQSNGVRADTSVVTVQASALPKVELSFFGLHVQGLATRGWWPSSRFGAIRLWDTETSWLNLEPTVGQWNFSVLDTYVATSEAANVSVLLTLGQTPSWAASDQTVAGAYAPGASSPPLRMADWDLYVRTLADRYKGRITRWEIWNEVNEPQFYSGSIQTLVDLTCHAARILKEVDNKNVVISPSIVGGGYGKLEAFFQAGGGSCVDVIGYHFYAAAGEPEDMLPIVHRVRALMTQYGQGSKSLWNTETGWLIANSDGGFGGLTVPSSWRRTQGDEAAGIVLRALALMMNEGLGAFYWYAWDDASMGLTERDLVNDSRRIDKPAAIAYQRAVEWFVGAYPQGCTTAGTITDCGFTVDGAILHLVWSASQDATYAVPGGGTSVILSDFRGNARTLLPGENHIPVGPIPQLVRIFTGKSQL
jgi:hypothetical protein